MNEFSEAAKEDDCRDEAHNDPEVLFGRECKDCGKLTIFADDANYSNVSSTRIINQQRIVAAFERIIEFLNSNGLEVNQAKTAMTEYMTRQKRVRMLGVPPELSVIENNEGRLENKVIRDKPYCRILGGNVSNDLSWSHHLSTGKKALLPMIRKQIGSLSSLRRSLPIKAKLKLANSFILSRLNYIISLWGNTTENQLRKVQVCLNSAARFVLDANKREKQSDLMKRCNWLSVTELVEFHSLLQLFKVLRWRIPESLCDYFETAEDDLISTRRARLKLTSQSWRCATTKRWNDLPGPLRSELRIGRFKAGLKRHIKARRDLMRVPD